MPCTVSHSLALSYRSHVLRATAALKPATVSDAEFCSGSGLGPGRQNPKPHKGGLEMQTLTTRKLVSEQRCLQFYTHFLNFALFGHVFARSPDRWGRPPVRFSEQRERLRLSK